MNGGGIKTSTKVNAIQKMIHLLVPFSPHIRVLLHLTQVREIDSGRAGGYHQETDQSVHRRWERPRVGRVGVFGHRRPIRFSH